MLRSKVYPCGVLQQIADVCYEKKVFFEVDQNSGLVEIGSDDKNRLDNFLSTEVQFESLMITRDLFFAICYLLSSGPDDSNQWF